MENRKEYLETLVKVKKDFLILNIMLISESEMQ